MDEKFTAKQAPSGIDTEAAAPTGAIQSANAFSHQHPHQAEIEQILDRIQQDEYSLAPFVATPSVGKAQCEGDSSHTWVASQRDLDVMVQHLQQVSCSGLCVVCNRSPSGHKETGIHIRMLSFLEEAHVVTRGEGIRMCMEMHRLPQVTSAVSNVAVWQHLQRHGYSTNVWF